MAIPVNAKSLTPQQLKDFKDLEKRLLGIGKNADVFADAINKANGNTSKIAQELKAMEGYVNGLTASTNQFNASLNDSLDLAKAIVDELKKQEGPIVRAKKAMSGLVSIGQQLVDEERELSAISEKRLKDLAREASTKLKNFQIEAQNVAGNLSVQAKILDNEKKILRINQLTNQAQISATKKLKEKLQDELNILTAFQQQKDSYQAIQVAAEKRYNLEKETSKTFGLTGAALSAAASIASKFGMSHVQDEIEEINSKLREDMRKEIELNGDKALGFGRRFAYAGKAIGQTVAVLAKGMMDPLFIMGKIYSAFLDVNAAGVEYTRLTGQNAVSTAGMNSSFASSVDVLKVMTELTKEMSLSAGAIFSAEDLGRLAQAKNLLGLSDKQAANLGIRSKVAGVGIEAYQKGIIKATNNYNATNKSVLAHGAVLQEVLNTSDSISLSLGGDPEKITAAATAAMSLGLNLQRVDEIASSLTDFQSSISNELEAELLTGKDLNLEKAREFALSNDLAGLSKELAKNGASAAEFGKMNRLQQESLAKALGMSREELAKSAQLELMRAGASKEAIEAAGDMTLEQLEQASIQDRIKVSLDKLAQSFAPILEALAPIAEMIANIVQPIAFVIAKMSSAVSGIVGPLMTVFGIFKGIQLVNTGILAATTAIGAAQAFIAAAKTSELGLGLTILANLGFQNAAEMYKLTLMTGGNTLAAIGAAIQQTTLYSILAQGAGIIKNTVLGAGRLIVEMAIAAAALMGVSALTLGIGTVVVVGAALAGYAALKSMSDGEIGADGRPTLFTGTDTVKLNQDDSIYTAKDGSMKVGTDLVGNKEATSGQSISSAAADMGPVVSELAALRAEMGSILNKILAKEGTVYMDSNKVGKAQILGSYKSA